MPAAELQLVELALHLSQLLVDPLRHLRLLRVRVRPQRVPEPEASLQQAVDRANVLLCKIFALLLGHYLEVES